MPATLTPEMLIERAQEQIQKILIDLEDEAGIEIDDVDVDTREFSNLRVQITIS